MKDNIKVFEIKKMNKKYNFSVDDIINSIGSFLIIYMLTFLVGVPLYNHMVYIESILLFLAIEAEKNKSRIHNISIIVFILVIYGFKGIDDIYEFTTIIGIVVYYIVNIYMVGFINNTRLLSNKVSGTGFVFKQVVSSIVRWLIVSNIIYIITGNGTIIIKYMSMVATFVNILFMSTIGVIFYLGYHKLSEMK